MGSNGRMPPPHIRRPLPGPGIIHPDAFGPGIRPPPEGMFPHFDVRPPPDLMEHKLQVQHLEMQRLATENQRLASTHGTLRKELATTQHDLHILESRIGAVKQDRQQQMTSLLDKIANMEAELKTADSLKLELQKTRENAQNMIGVRQELISKVQQLGQDLRRAHSDGQQIPSLMSELDGLRQEYQHCRATYDYEKKLYSDHLESLQVMENNYLTMAREVEKLRAELINTANVNNGRIGALYGVAAGYNENEAFGNHPVGQNTYEEGYTVPQGHAPLPLVGGAVPVDGVPTYVGGQSGPTPGRPGYDVPRVQGYDPQRGPSYDAQRGPGYDAQRGPGYDAQRGPGYDAQRGTSYGAQREPGFEVQTGSGHDAQKGINYDHLRGQGFNMQWGQLGYEAQRGLNYDTSKGASHEVQYRGSVGAHVQAAPTTNVAYGSALPQAPVGNGYETQPRVGNHNSVRR